MDPKIYHPSRKLAIMLREFYEFFFFVLPFSPFRVDLTLWTIRIINELLSENSIELPVTVTRLLSGAPGKIFQVSGVVNSLTVDSLTPGTEYVILISAANQYGIGPWSEEVSGETSSIEARIEGKTRKCTLLKLRLEQIGKLSLLVCPF